MSQPEQVGSRAEPGGAEQGAPLVQLGEQEAARRPAAEPGGTTAGLYSDIWSWKRTAILLACISIGAVILSICFGVKSSGKNSSVSPAVNPCPADWLCYQNECYYLSEQENNWNSSQRDCSSRKASLFVPKNQQELQFITKITKQDPWIGLHKKGEDFFWVNGTAMNKNLWQVKGSGECAYIESEEISFSGCSLTRNWETPVASSCLLGRLFWSNSAPWHKDLQSWMRSYQISKTR
ncbi:C-type lectin domain family 2 member L [Alligator mississippiensis]|uniref:C-type lectin domain family 2 member L n=1 Tax=Alligator mississippiensis TaxID=8496 RepID=A0A151NLI6_ALLMI|nr:C-type lectin domain family 2 member L [Alligator mississippiensis]